MVKLVNTEDKIYGPYKRTDGRWIIIINGITKSYPKYLYEKHHNVVIVEPDTIDHIDGNPNNNDIINLRVLHRKENARLGNINKIPASGYTWSTRQKKLISGDFNQAAKLTNQQVTKYRELYRYAKITKNQIMKETGMCRRSVENFLDGKTYK